jgi:hypothetical protein
VDSPASGSDAGAESGADAGPGDATEGCLALRNATIAQLARCNGVSAAVAGYTYYSGSGAYYCGQIAAAVAAGKVTYDASGVAACTAGLAAQTCEDPTTPASCTNLLLGTVPAGGACNDSIECAGVDVCTGSTCPGMCGPGVASGGDCSSQPCANALSCVYNTTTNAQTCQALLSSGAPCDPNADACTYGLYCDAGTSHCLPVKTSGACTGNGCAAGYVCSSTGQCQMAKAEGASCTAGQGECALGLYCTGGTCAQWPQPGGTCGNLQSGEYAGCQTGCCAYPADSGATGTCVAPGSTGASCNNAAACPICGDGTSCSAAGACAATSCY